MSRVLQVDYPLTYEKLRAYGFDLNAEVLLALEVVGVGLPLSRRELPAPKTLFGIGHPSFGIARLRGRAGDPTHCSGVGCVMAHLLHAMG